MNFEMIPMSAIKADDNFNIRKVVDVTDLVESIQTMGVLTPVMVQKKGASYTLIAGFRRFRAAQQVGLTEIPATMAPPKASKTDLMLLNLLENSARSALSPIEEAEGVDRLIRSGMEQDEVRRKLGWTSTMFTQRTGLLKLAPGLQEALRSDQLTVRQAPIIDALPEGEHAEFIEKARDLPVEKLRQLVNARLDQLNRTGDTEPETVAQAERADAAERPKTTTDDREDRSNRIKNSIARLLQQVYEESPAELEDANEQLAMITFTSMQPNHLAIFDTLMSEAALAAEQGVAETDDDGPREVTELADDDDDEAGTSSANGGSDLTVFEDF